MWGDHDPRIHPGIAAQRALDLADRIAELAHERASLRLIAEFERDRVLADLIVELRVKLHIEMQALRADPAGVLGRVRTSGGSQ